MNPWNLTDCEEQAIEAYIAHGGDKAAGRSLNKSDNTIATQLQLARAKMGVKSRVEMAVKYDRWKRAPA